MIQTRTYTDIATKPDAQVPRERVRLSADGSDEYEDLTGSDLTESDTEPDREEDDITDATGARLSHWSRTPDEQTTNLGIDSASFDHLQLTGGSTH